jgi:hypothetical protein
MLIKQMFIISFSIAIFYFSFVQSDKIFSSTNTIAQVIVNQPVTNSQNTSKTDYSMNFPTGWKVYQNREGFDLVGMGPGGIIVGIKEGPASVNVDQFFDAGVKLIPQTIQDFSVVDQGKATIDGKDARWIIYRGKLVGRDAEVLQYFIINKNRAYIIFATTDPNNFSTVKDSLFNLVSSSFKFSQ